MVMGVFKSLSGLDSLECLETIFVHQHVAFPIFRWGIRLSLGSWALVALVITFKFLLNSSSFLLEMIGVSNSGPLPFQAHLISA
jgi:hypothetical protein